MIKFLKSHLSVALIIISASIILSGILFFKSQLFKILGTNTDNTEILDSSLNTYSSVSLGIEFKYPIEWGELEFKAEPCFSQEKQYFTDLDGEPCVHIFLLAPEFENNPLVVSAQSRLFGLYTQTREQYFGDIISVVRKEGIDIGEFIRDYCTKEAKANNAENCERKTNPNGVPYVKVYQELIVKNPEKPDKKALYYLIYHAEHEFDGVIISSEFFSQDLGLSEIESSLDKVLSSVKFI